VAFGGSGNVSIHYLLASQTSSLDSFSYVCDSSIPQPERANSIVGWKDNGQTIIRMIKFPKWDPGHTSDDF